MSAEKKARSLALAAFTRHLNLLNSLMDNEDQVESLVTSQFQKVQVSWEKLEGANDSFLAKAEIDVCNDPDGLKFLSGPEEKHSSAVGRYSQFLKRSQLEGKSREAVLRIRES